MFVRVVVQDTIKIQCYQLEKDKFAQFVSDVLHAKYANKVLPGQGLVILVQDYENVGSPYVYPGHGAVHISVKVGLLVFRPMVEQVVQGNIRYCDPSGILGIF
jgi:DNA-directed RNA polymerase subunit E'/Rpb7